MVKSKLIRTFQVNALNFEELIELIRVACSSLGTPDPVIKTFLDVLVKNKEKLCLLPEQLHDDRVD